MCLHRDARADANGVGRNARSGRGDERRFRGERSSRMRRRSEDETTGTCHCVTVLSIMYIAPLSYVLIRVYQKKAARSRVRAPARIADARRNAETRASLRGGREGVGASASLLQPLAPVPRRARGGPARLAQVPRQQRVQRGRGGRGRRRASGRVAGGRVAGGRVAGGRVAGGRVASGRVAGGSVAAQARRRLLRRGKSLSGSGLFARAGGSKTSSKTSSEDEPSPRAAANAPRTPSAPSRPPASSSSGSEDETSGDAGDATSGRGRPEKIAGGGGDGAETKARDRTGSSSVSTRFQARRSEASGRGIRDRPGDPGADPEAEEAPRPSI